jgi:hypothetical protein
MVKNLSDTYQKSWTQSIIWANTASLREAGGSGNTVSCVALYPVVFNLLYIN